MRAGPRLVTGLRVLVGVGSFVFLAAYAESNNCDMPVAAGDYSCPYDRATLGAAVVAFGVTMVAAAALLVRWTGERRRRLAGEAELWADIERWRREHEVAPWPRSTAGRGDQR